MIPHVFTMLKDSHIIISIENKTKEKIDALL